MPSDGTGHETVYVAGRQNGGGGMRKVHTDPQCPALREAKTVLDRPRDACPNEIDWCRMCTGEVDRSGPQDHSYYKALIDAARADRE